MLSDFVGHLYTINVLRIVCLSKMIKQAGAELGQAQVQLGLIRLQISLALPNISIGLS